MLAPLNLTYADQDVQVSRSQWIPSWLEPNLSYKLCCSPLFFSDALESIVIILMYDATVQCIWAVLQLYMKYQLNNLYSLFQPLPVSDHDYPCREGKYIKSVSANGKVGRCNETTVSMPLVGTHNYFLASDMFNKQITLNQTLLREPSWDYKP